MTATVLDITVYAPDLPGWVPVPRPAQVDRIPFPTLTGNGTPAAVQVTIPAAHGGVHDPAVSMFLCHLRAAGLEFDCLSYGVWNQTPELVCFRRGRGGRYFRSNARGEVTMTVEDLVGFGSLDDAIHYFRRPDIGAVVRSTHEPSERRDTFPIPGRAELEGDLARSAPHRLDTATFRGASGAKYRMAVWTNQRWVAAPTITEARAQEGWGVALVADVSHIPVDTLYGQNGTAGAEWVPLRGQTDPGLLDLVDRLAALDRIGA